MEDRRCSTCKYNEVLVFQEPCLTCYSSDNLTRYPCWVSISTVQYESPKEFAKRKYSNTWPSNFDSDRDIDMFKFAEEYASERISK